MVDKKTKALSSLKKMGFGRSRVGGPEQNLAEAMQRRQKKDNGSGYKPPPLGNKYGNQDVTSQKFNAGAPLPPPQFPNSEVPYDANDTSDASFSGGEKPLKSFVHREIFPMTTVDSEGLMSEESEFVLVKQRIAYLCIAVTAIQLMVLLSQLILCGVASVEINPMIGPFPDAISEWGGKNAYLLIERNQYFRIITPVFLHVGVLHLLVNAFCQLETCAYFEREWGSGRWLILYIISGVGCVATSSAVNPDIIGVCSSGALMGLFGAKIAHVITWTAFELHNNTYYDTVHLDQLSGVMCSTVIISILSFFSYIDFSGHMGGLLAGFLGGIFIFSQPIASPSIRVLWGSIGLFGLVGLSCFLGNVLNNETFPDEDLADACSYFRTLYPEGYDCECAWD
jgi:membrane associated rhomboid family serine protease